MQATTAKTIKGQRVFWEGPLFGRLTKAGKEHLVRHGFDKILPSTSGFDGGNHDQHGRLSLVWPNKSGPQFEVHDSTAAHIRPYPKSATDRLDDKIKLSRIFQGKTDVMPGFIASPDEAVQGNLYFVKHRRGAQGKSVYVFNDQQELQEWWWKSKNPHDFLIQEEIVPVLCNHRKFVLRSHILLFQQRNHGNSDGSLLVALLHNDIICQMHSVPYYPPADSGPASTNNNASHISQTGGNKLPEPILLDNLDPSHPAAGAFRKVEECSKKFVATIAPIFSKEYQDLISAETTCFALLGIDILLDKDDGTAKLCEVNSHPALGWGTMAKVPNEIFDSLIGESLSILMFGDSIMKDTGYRRIL